MRLSFSGTGRTRQGTRSSAFGVGIIIRSSQAMRVCRAHFVRAPLQESAIGASLHLSTADAALTSLSGPPPQQARAGTRLALASGQFHACVCNFTHPKRMIYHFGRPSQDFRDLRRVQFQRSVVQFRYSHPLKRASKRHSGMFVRPSKMSNSSFGLGKIVHDTPAGRLWIRPLRFPTG